MMILALQNHARDFAFSFDPAALAETIKCNVTGPALVTRFLLPSIEKSSRKVIVNISSSLTSIGRDLGPISTSYSISKMGLNMLVRDLVTDLFLLEC
jgi:NAD(P)-dependent dehydrogenase (short-subunit alcohol dehydrogenase family)